MEYDVSKIGLTFQSDPHSITCIQPFWPILFYSSQLSNHEGFPFLSAYHLLIRHPTKQLCSEQNWLEEFYELDKGWIKKHDIFHILISHSIFDIRKKDFANMLVTIKEAEVQNDEEVNYKVAEGTRIFIDLSKCAPFDDVYAWYV